MRNLKRVLALALALVMMLGMMITASAATYADADAIDAKYTEAVDTLTGMGVFKGTGAGFAPKAVLTRAEAAALIYRVLTGDVTDAQVINYNYSSFDDVAAGQWYTGYITYAANGGYIKGYDGKAMPNDTVTGVQVMAIMLRAIGYGQNGEYEGAGWMDNILTDAKELGITGTIATSTLIAPATREVVAQLIFNALTGPAMVTYTPALGYLAVDFNSLAWRGGNTLGYKVFGLTDGYGIVVGNQATGEVATKIQMKTATGYAYAYADATSYETVTDLNLFGHAVKVWYNAKDTVGAVQTYSLFDKATNVAVVEGKSNADAFAAGFDIPVSLKNSQAPAVAAYCNDSYGPTYWAGNAQSNYPIYVMISNSADKALDLVIGVDASVRMVNAVNNYIAKPTVTLSTIGSIERAQITSGAENAVVGNYVIVNEITGTANTKVANAPYYALDTVTQTKTGKIISVAVNGTVTLADGTTIAQSPLYNYSDVTKTLTAGVQLTFVLDNQGKYVGAVQPRAEWMYATYVYWEQTGLSTITYYLQGVTPAGEITTITVDKAAYDYLANTTTGISFENYGGDTVTKVDNYKMVKIINNAFGGKTVDKTATWNDTIDTTLTAASYQVKAGEFLTASTVYHVVSGYGDTLKVVPYTGVIALLDGATSVDVEGVYSKVTTSTTTVANYNYIVTNVLLADADLTYTGNFFYSGTTTPTATSTSYDGTTQLFNLYVAGEATKSGVWVTNPSAIAADTFYTYVKSYDNTLGTYVYTLTAKMGAGAGSGYAGLTLTQAVDSALGYVAIDDWANDPQYNAAEAKVIDLTTAGAITSVDALNTAVETNTVKVDCLFDAKENITVIYVVSVTQA